MKKYNRILEYWKIESAQSLRDQILSSLKLSNQNIRFEKKIDVYFKRRPSLKIELNLNIDLIEKDIRNEVLLKINSLDFPSNYIIGSPHNRWLFGSIKNDNSNTENVQKQFDDEMNDFQNTIEFLENYFKINWTG